MFSRIALDLLRYAQTRPVCIDVGSAGGFHPRLAAIESEVDIIGFDADPEECARLNAAAKPGSRHINYAIGRENEKVTLELHKKAKTSSLYKTDRDRVSHYYDAERFMPVGEISFTTRSLDSVAASERIGRIDYLKVDVEGHELAVLEGCAQPFLFAEIEVYFHPFRQGACSFDAIMKHMRERGFMLIDLRRNFWSPRRTREVRNYGSKGVLMHGDALFCVDPFLKENHSLLSARDARARLFALMSLYGYTAESLMFIDALRKAELMPADEAAAFENIIVKGSPHRKYPARLGRVMLLLEKFFKMPVAIRSGLSLSTYFQADGDLGNSD